MDDRRWAALWTMMLDRWNADKSPEIGAFYADQLTGRLTDEEIETGVERTMYSSAYFPTPEEIVKQAKGTGEERALDDWEHCQRIMEGQVDRIEDMSPAGQKTVALLGGPHRLRQTPLDSVPFVRKEFFRLHGHAQEIHERQAHELPAWTEEGERVFNKLLSGDGDTP